MPYGNTKFMKCDNNGFDCFKPATADETFGGKRERYAADCDLQLDVTTAVPLSFDRKPVLFSIVPAVEDNSYQFFTHFDSPFMNNMDEIAYWVHTKRAPCLYGFDNTNNKLDEQAHCSKNKPKINDVKEVPSPKKKNKRKLVLDGDSYSTEKEKSVIFFTSDDQQKKALKNGKPVPSSSVGSDIDFNIKNSSIQMKPKRMRLQRTSKLSYVKKNNVATSTPKVTALRRSLRKSQKNINNNTQLDSSFEIMNYTYTSGGLDQIGSDNKNTNKPLESNALTDSKNIEALDQNKDNVNNKSKNEMALNGQFEDMSDVSGFTANYIRSTKINSTKTPRNVRNKLNRDFIKESQQRLQKADTRTVMCVNKSMNTGLPDSTVLNCSTDSSQNVVNLVTVNNSEKSTKVSRSTSLLKFLDAKQTDSKECLLNNELKQPDKNESFQSYGTSRYPTRRKAAVAAPVKINCTRNSPERQKRACKMSCEFNNSDRKENPGEELISRTRSGRKIGLQVRQPENSVLVISNSTEQVSSTGAVNVADPGENCLVDTSRRKRHTGRYSQSKKSADKSRQSLKRDKSGFAECFSESDDDSELLKQKKFFC